jgi:serine/threonine protein kinase
VCDFGLSRIFIQEQSSGLTTTTLYGGTERYLAPELVDYDNIRLPTLETDIWALGCVGLRVSSSCKNESSTEPSSSVYIRNSSICTSRSQLWGTNFRGYPRGSPTYIIYTDDGPIPDSSRKNNRTHLGSYRFPTSQSLGIRAFLRSPHYLGRENE